MAWTFVMCVYVYVVRNIVPLLGVIAFYIEARKLSRSPTLAILPSPSVTTRLSVLTLM